MTASIPHPKTAPFNPSKADIERLKSAQKAIADITGRMEALAERHDVKAILAEAPARYAKGDVDLPTAILAAAASSTAVNDLVPVLRRACKAELRAIYQSFSDLIAAADAHHISELTELCKATETQERKQSSDLGIHPDEFQPSPALNSLRETHKRAAALAPVTAPTAADFVRLVAAV